MGLTELAPQLRQMLVSECDVWVAIEQVEEQLCVP